MDGWQWMGSDDDFPIRQVLPVGLPWGSFLHLGSFGLVFRSQKDVYE
jgi:hypothetical protein